jgi:hypothetical protein
MSESSFETGEGLSPRIQTPHPARISSAPPSPTEGEGKNRQPPTDDVRLAHAGGAGVE